jgi:RNA polymerase sigma-70 factor (ECF subfamily)
VTPPANLPAGKSSIYSRPSRHYLVNSPQLAVEEATVTAILSMPPPGQQDHAPVGGDVDLLARFVSGGDQSAFRQLIERHGPMVLGVCRRVLGNHHDAEDAFQAVFVLLARKAASIRHPERLASWLYGVAHRTAQKLREGKNRRREVERQAPAGAAPPLPPLELAWREVQQALDEEISRLDGKLRAPLILCYLEGKSHEDAARELGRPLGSMSWLLSRGLAALRERLAGRGLTLTGGMSSLLLALQCPVPVSGPLLLATLRSLGVLGTASPIVLLAEAVLRELAAERTSKLVRAVVISFLVLLGASAAGYAAVASGLSDPPWGSSSGAPTAGSSGGCGGSHK